MLEQSRPPLERWFDRRIIANIEFAFYRHGLFCATNPIAVILATLLAATALSLPSSQVLFGQRTQSMRNNHDNSSVRYNIWTSNVRLSNESISNAPKWLRTAIDVPPTRVTQIRFSSSSQSDFSDGNWGVMSRPFLRKVGFEIPSAINSFTTIINGSSYSLADFCTLGKSSGACVMHHPGAIWDWNQTLFEQDMSLSSIAFYPAKVASASLKSAGNRPEAQLSTVPDVPTGTTVVPLEAIPRASLLSNLRIVPGVSYLSADAAILTLSMRPQSDPDVLRVEAAFMETMWQHLGVNTPVQQGGFTYLKYWQSSRQNTDKFFFYMVYTLVFFYIYLTIAQFEFVKSKFGLGIAGVLILLYSTMMAAGICALFGYITTVTAIEVLPFLVVAIGLDNMTVITSSIVSKWGLPIRFQVAEGLAKAGPQLMRSMLSMETMLLLGVYSRISALQDFCAIACVAVLCDFVLQVVLYVAVLSLDIRRVELSDFSRPWFMKAVSSDGHASLANPTSSARAWNDPKFSPSVYNNLSVIICGLAAVMFAFLGGVTASGSKLVIPNMLVDWRTIIIGSNVEDNAVIEFAPFSVDLDLDASHEPNLSTQRTWIPHFLSVLFPALNHHIFLFGGSFLLCSYGMSRLSAYLQRIFLGEREELDLVEAFGTIQSFDIATFTGHKADIEGIEISSRKTGGNSMFASACLGGQVRVWDEEHGRCIEVLHCRVEDSSTEDDVLTPWCLTMHETFVAAGYAAGMIQIWDLATREMVVLPSAGPLPGQGEPTLYDGGAITCLEFFENALLSGSSTGVLQLWHWSYGMSNNIPEETITVRATAGIPIRNSSVYELTRLSENPGGGLADTRLTFQCIKSKNFHNSGVSVVKITDNYIITGSNDKLVKIFDKNLNSVRSLFGHKDIITCLDVFEDILVTGAADNTLRIWSIETGTVKFELVGHTDSIISTCVNSLHVVSSSEDDTVRVWDTRTGACTSVMKESSPIALHPSSILVTVCNGSLTAWDLLGQGERLRTIPLISDTGPFNKIVGSTTTNHLRLQGDRVICDLGWQLKCVALPFPQPARRKLKGP